jgi:hypothetical protein
MFDPAASSHSNRLAEEDPVEFDKALIDTIATVISTLTLLLVAYQIRQVTTWNRRQSPFNFIDTDKGRLLEASLDEELRALGIDVLQDRRNSPLTPKK